MGAQRISIYTARAPEKKKHPAVYRNILWSRIHCDHCHARVAQLKAGRYTSPFFSTLYICFVFSFFFEGEVWAVYMDILWAPINMYDIK